MNELKLKILNWWQDLQMREKRMVSIGGGITAVLIIYFGMLWPISDALQGLRKQIQSQQHLLTFMQDAEHKLKQQHGAAQTVEKIHSPVKMLGYVKNILNENGLESHTTSLQQSGNQTIVLQMQNASFDKFVSVLYRMISEQQIVVQSLEVTAAANAGQVNLNLQFQFD